MSYPKVFSGNRPGARRKDRGGHSGPGNRMRGPTAIGVASLGVVAGRIVGQELHAYWRLHRVTRALARPGPEDPASQLP
jgi:hypothetical protein